MSVNETPPGLRVNGSRATEIIPLPPGIDAPGPWAHRLKMRMMSIDEFIASGRASGTLRKNRAIGMNVASHALHERVCYEFGYPWEACLERCVTWGEARSEGDCKPLTEVGWHVERFASVVMFPGDEVEVKYLTVEIGGVRREGVGMVLRKTSVPWLPPGFIVFCLITTYDPKTHDFLPAANPS